MSAPEDEAAHATALLEACPALYQRAYATTRRDYRERFDSGGGGPLPLFPPMMVEMEQQPSRKRALPPSCKTPFLCTAAGCLPRGVPDDVDDLLSAYLVSGVSRASPNLWEDPTPEREREPKPEPTPEPKPKPKPNPGVSRASPNLDVAGQSVECSSNGQARRELAKASEQGKPYWVACHVPIDHPPWWPAGGANPNPSPNLSPNPRPETPTLALTRARRGGTQAARPRRCLASSTSSWARAAQVSDGWVGGWVNGWLAGWVSRHLSHAYANLHRHPLLHLLSATCLHTVCCQASACIATATRETASPCAPQGSTPRTSSRPQAGVHACYSRVRALWRGQERLVSTYLSLGRGRKHVILLPPTAEVRATPPFTHTTPHTSPHTPPTVRPTPRAWPGTPHMHSSHAPLTGR